MLTVWSGFWNDVDYFFYICFTDICFQLLLCTLAQTLMGKICFVMWTNDNNVRCLSPSQSYVSPFHGCYWVPNTLCLDSIYHFRLYFVPLGY